MRYLGHAMRSDRRSGFTGRALTAALAVALGRPGELLVRAVRKLARDPGGFFALVGDQLTRHGRALVANPMESVIMARERFADREELRGKRTGGGGVMPWPPCPYDIDENWEARLHDLLGAPWPCSRRDDFGRLWEEVMWELQSKRGLSLGRGAFAGWGDGEPGLVRAAWCLTHHLRPETIVETGVARGITSRFLLEALDHNGSGHLWSIDLPPPLDRDLHAQIGIAVPPRLHGRWSYIRGSSRRRLPGLLARVKPVGLFLHDSTHTARNLRFELQHAWDALAPGGFVVADDVDLNCGFHEFKRSYALHPSLVCHAEPIRPDYVRQDERGVFAMVRKSSRS